MFLIFTLAALFSSGVLAGDYTDENRRLYGHNKLFSDYCIESRQHIVGQIENNPNDFRFSVLTRKIFGKISPHDNHERSLRLAIEAFEGLSRDEMIEICKVAIEVSSQVEKIFESTKNKLLISPIDDDAKRFVNILKYAEVKCDAASQLASVSGICQSTLSRWNVSI